VDLQGKGVTLGMNFWTTPWTYPKLLWKKMTHIKDLRFHPLVLGSLRNQFFTINAVFYMKSYTLQGQWKAGTAREIHAGAKGKKAPKTLRYFGFGRSISDLIKIHPPSETLAPALVSAMSILMEIAR
jgi:hypothetical protein